MNRKSAKIVPMHPEAASSNRGSRELAVEWFESHRHDLLRYARRVLPASECPEDLVQDVFYRILQQEALESLRNPRAFLMTMTRNAAIDRLRKIKAMPEGNAVSEQPGQSPLQEAEMIIAVERALKELPARCREVFVLRRFKGMDTSAIARQMGISPRMVQKHLNNAMAHFHDRLGLHNRKEDK